MLVKHWSSSSLCYLYDEVHRLGKKEIPISVADVSFILCSMLNSLKDGVEGTSVIIGHNCNKVTSVIRFGHKCNKVTSVIRFGHKCNKVTSVIGFGHKFNKCFFYR